MRPSIPFNPPRFEPLEPRRLFAATPVGEAGTLSVAQPDAVTWHDVTLLRSYVNPVVVMNVVTENDADPLTIRVKDVTATGFSFQLDEWDYLDGVHGTETVTYLVVEAGTHTLDDGSVLQAGVASVGDTFVTVNLPTAMPTTPVVLTQVTSVNEADAVVTRTRSVTTTSFQSFLQEQEPTKGPHVAESVSWIAHSPAVGSSGERDFESAMTGDSVTDAVTNVGFTQVFAGAPVVLADLQSYDGSDTVNVRMNNLGTAGFDVRMQEEQAGDTDTSHTTEVVGYFAVDAGLLNIGANTAPNVSDDAGNVNEDATLIVTAGSGVLANDADGEGGPLTAVLLTGPTQGTLSLAADGSYTYTPNADYHGGDSFTYQARDVEGAVTIGTVTLTVDPVNDAPVAGDDVFNAFEDTVLTGSLAGNDADIDFGDTLTYTLLTPPGQGGVVIDADGSFRYAGRLEYSGPDSFTYRVDDGNGGSDTATVTLTVEPVDDPPDRDRGPLLDGWQPRDVADPPESPGAAEPTRARLGEAAASRPIDGPIGHTAERSFVALPEAALLAEAELEDGQSPTTPDHTPPAAAPLDETLAEVQPEAGASHPIAGMLSLALARFFKRRGGSRHT